MRKYKRKIGGAATQPATPQVVNQTTKQTISGSISNTYDYTKDLIRNISNYVTENFIFVLIAGVLIIFYLYLFSTDPVTQEDLDELVVTIKCKGGFKGTCPDGQTNAGSIPCVNNECNEETCCRETLYCSTWTPTCPEGQSKVLTNPCISDEFSECSPEACCQKDCSSGNFVSTQCTDNSKIYNPNNICEGSQCLISDCCDDKITCQGYQCPDGKIYRPGYTDIICNANGSGPECDVGKCCTDPNPTEESDAAAGDGGGADDDGSAGGSADSDSADDSAAAAGGDSAGADAGGADAGGADAGAATGSASSGDSATGGGDS